MTNDAYTEKSEEMQSKILTLFKNSVSDAIYSTWADSFEVELLPSGKVTVYYHGTLPVKRFKKDCSKALWVCICSVVGYRKNIDVKKRKSTRVSEKVTATPKKKKAFKAIRFLILGMFFACLALGIGIITCNYVVNREFKETFYTVSSMKVDNQVRVIQLSDLHSLLYGEKNEMLVDRIRKLKPDLILCTGDMIDSLTKDTLPVEELGKALSDVAPLYYVYGNNERERVYDFSFNQDALDEKFGFEDGNRDEDALVELEDPLEVLLESAGFRVLKNEADTVKVGKTTVDVYGVLSSNPSSFWSYSKNRFGAYLNENENNLKITFVHEPFIFESFQPDSWGDLMLCGHTHGGEIRVPVLGPLYTREGGLFPERNACYVYGRYTVSGRPLIVSSGLDNANLLRLNNQPEIVIIDINKF